MFLNLKYKAVSVLVFVAAAVALLVPTPVLAAHCDVDRAGHIGTEQELSIPIQDPNDPTGQTLIHCIPKYGATVSLDQNPIISFLKSVLQFMAVGIGIVLVIGFVVGGIVYLTARANPQQIQKAEEIIRNDVIAIALFVFLFAIINFLIPGGILN